jgi:hypothetical protein
MALAPACLAPTPGGVVEWLMAPVLKTGEVKASAGSNPAPSVFADAQPTDESAGVWLLERD